MERLTKEQLDSLQYDVCNSCGLAHPPPDSTKGIMAMMNHPCSGNKHTYKILAGSKLIKMFRDLFTPLENQENLWQVLDELIHSPKLLKMSNFHSATSLEIKWYWHERQMDIAQKKRIEIYKEKEEELSFRVSQLNSH